MPFHLSTLPRCQFEHLLFDLSTDELAPHRAVRMFATKKPGFPCRVSLADAEIGEGVILVNFERCGAGGSGLGIGRYTQTGP